MIANDAQASNVVQSFTSCKLTVTDMNGKVLDTLIVSGETFGELEHRADVELKKLDGKWPSRTYIFRNFK